MNKLKWGDYSLLSKWILNVITSILIKIKQRELRQKRRRYCDLRGGDSKATNASSHRTLEEARKVWILPWWEADTLILAQWY